MTRALQAVLHSIERRVLATLLALLSAGAMAQGAGAYPEKGVRVLVPFAPGGIADGTARGIAQHLSETWGRPFVVENRPSAASILAFTTVAKAAPDGYTLLLANTNIATNPSLYAKLDYDADRDLVPVAFGLLTPGVLVVHPSVPAANYAELVALARAQPGKVNFASVGIGSFPHLALEMLKQMAGLDMVHVPYKGFAPAMTAVLANEVSLLALDIPAALPQVRAGKLRALASTGLRRSSALPDLPSVAELGLRDYEAVGWLGIMAPAGTPRDIVMKLNEEINRGVRRNDLFGRYTSTGAEIQPGSPEDFGAFIRRQGAAWGRVIRAGNVKAE